MQATRRAVLLAAAGAAAACAPKPAKPLIVFAAISIADAVEEACKTFSPPVTVSAAASSALARQLREGAPADLFISADEAWMDDVIGRGRMQAETRTILARNALVLIAPADAPVGLSLQPGLDLRAALGPGRLALGDPSHVPAGRYAQAALQALGAWEGVKDRLAPAQDVRGALAYVARREAPLGIVYATDAAADARVRIVAAFPETTHPPIVYPAALTKTASPAAASLLRHLLAGPAQALLAARGFLPP